MSVRSLLMLAVIMIMPLTTLNSQPWLGGEITWECTPQGNFRFILKIHRECAMPSFISSFSLQTNAPGFSTIQVSRIAINEISPTCGCPGGQATTCATTPYGQQHMYTGAVEQHIYTSDASYPNGVPLTGVPPETGWYFALSSCCRNPCHNIQNASSLSFVYRAFMYPYKNTPVNNCFDNAPVFAEDPAPIICIGHPTVFNYSARDPDGDYLTYEWAQSLNNNIITPITTWNPGYTYASPLPGTSHHISNVPANLGRESGFVEFKSFTAGVFNLVVKVTSYKEGIKVSEVFREFYQVLQNCDTSNAPPQVSAPFPNNTVQTTDTVSVGDTVTFTISAQDFQYCPGTSPPVNQTIYLYAFGEQFGTPVYSTGCNTPPCATLTPSPAPAFPLAAPIGVATQFNWQTTCEHIKVINDTLARTKYSFLFRANDDFCPTPKSGYSIANIVILPKPRIVQAPPITCVAVKPDGDVEILWTMPDDTMNTFQNYILYYSDSPSGPFFPVDTIPDINVLSTIHVKGADDSKPVYYYLTILNQCTGTDRVSPPCDTVRTMSLSVKILSVFPPVMELEWNHPGNSLLPGSAGYYNVYRSVSPGQWTLAGTTSTTLFTDTITQMLQLPQYYVELADTASGVSCLSTSNIASAKIASDDVGVIDILWPVNDTVAGSLVYPKITLANFGLQQQTTIPMSLFVDSVLFGIDTWTGTLLPFDTVHYTLAIPYTVPAKVHQLCVVATLASDTVFSNNIFCKNYSYISGAETNEMTGFALGNNIPNPALNKTTIPFTLPGAGTVKLMITDLTGKILSESTYEADNGSNFIEIDIRSLSSGIYFYTLSYRSEKITRKMVVSRE